jgi:hypothetical protein
VLTSNTLILRLAIAVCLGVQLLPAQAGAFEHRHGLGIGYQFAHVGSDSGGSYQLQSLPISYVGRYGGDFAAMTRVGLLVPLSASDGGHSFSPQAEYDRTRAFDVFVGPNYRFTKIWGWSLDAGLGPHINYTRFQSTQYVEWTNAAVGLAAACGARTPLGAGFWGGVPEVGVQVDFSYDFIDLAHGGDLSAGVAGQALVSLSWAMGTQKK